MSKKAYLCNQYVQYGSGWSAPAGWLNFDASPTLRFERLPILGRLYTKNAARFPENVQYGDIVKGLPITEGACQAVYCSHVLEHLSLYDFRLALKNTRRLLQSGGKFRLVLPDLENCINNYMNNSDANSALIFMRQTGLGSERRSTGLKSFIIDWFGNSRHQWMWDYKSLEVELLQAGFGNVRRAMYGDSQEPKFSEVEEFSRWENCLGIECSV